MILTYRFRLSDKHASELNRQARAVNYVWNYCNETQRKAAMSGRKWLSDVDLQRLTAGSGPMLGIRAQTVCKVCKQYAHSRKQHKKAWLRFRGRRALGWIPLHQESLGVRPNGFRYMGRILEIMHERALPADAKLRGGSLSACAKGKWYLNVWIETYVTRPERASGHVGIDLGLKSLATLSNGRAFDVPQFYRRSEMAIATAQRARKTKRVRAIRTKVADRRKDFLHKLSNQLTKEFGLIVVGDVSPSKLARTRFAKSVLDAGWSDLRRMLSYKSIRNGGTCLEVSERMTTQTCSACGSTGGPKGIAGLRDRMWKCDCGTVHDRDVNSARNILAIGLDSLGGGAARMRSSQLLDASSLSANKEGGKS